MVAGPVMMIPMLIAPNPKVMNQFLERRIGDIWLGLWGDVFAATRLP